MATKKKLLQAAAGNAIGGFTAIEDVFSTYLYTGNGSTQTITNGIDLAGEGGLVWIKCRSAVTSHVLFDTERGPYDALLSNSTGAELNLSPHGVTSFGSAGFSLSDISSGINAVNGSPGGTYSGSSATYASWTFRKAPRFFDVVTWTGDGTNGRQIAHNLAHEVGCCIIKKTSASGDWWVYHRGAPANSFGILNGTNSFTTGSINSKFASEVFGDGNFFQAPTDTFIEVSSFASNENGSTYVAYLFAHDPLGPSGDGSDGLIACGSFTTDASGLASVNLGWEPQWVMVKRSDSTGTWLMLDNMRGMPNGSDKQWLGANSANAEASNASLWHPTATGFDVVGGIGTSGTYIYIAIRRGPMRPPESGSEVFATGLNSSGSYTVSTGWPADFAIQRNRTATNFFSRPYARLTGTNYLETTSTAAESGGGTAGWANNTGYSNSTITSTVDWVFRRAPEFFDVVAYTGTGSVRTVAHNLGVTPELMIVKNRSASAEWDGYHIDVGPTKTVQLSTRAAPVTAINTWNSTTPTADVFTVGSGSANTSGNNYIAYLFASKTGVSKVGSYTGNGSSQTIDCGFTAGARFVLVKKVDNIGTSPDGSWYVWDTARGIVSGNDPYLGLNLTSSEITSEDAVDPASVGFVVNQVAASNINVSGTSYIFMAIS